jgi:hypothetical protein
MTPARRETLTKAIALIEATTRAALTPEHGHE